MATIRCPLCGSESLENRHGNYSLEPPANTPGGMTISDTTWQHCANCGEDLLPRALTRAIETEQRRRLPVAIPAKS